MSKSTRRLAPREVVNRSRSDAVAVKLIVWPGFTVRLLMTVSTSAAFTSLTTFWKLLVALKDVAFAAIGFVSVRLMKTRFVPGPCDLLRFTARQACLLSEPGRMICRQSWR